MAVHLLILETHFGLEPVPNCKPSTYHLLADDLVTLSLKLTGTPFVVVYTYFYAYITLSSNRERDGSSDQSFMALIH